MHGSMQLFFLYLIYTVFRIYKSKIEKVPRDIQVERLITTSSGYWSQQLEYMLIQKGTDPGVGKGKRFLLALHTLCKCSLKTTHNSVKVNLGIKIIQLVKCLIGNGEKLPFIAGVII